MNKRHVLMIFASQRQNTFFPGVELFCTFKELIEIEKKFAKSEAIVRFFEHSFANQMLTILMYEDKTGTLLRRSIAYGPYVQGELLQEHIRDMGKRIGVNFGFHTKKEYSKIVPVDKFHRKARDIGIEMSD